jgi:lipoprotein-anchoring transpeptidase ErfK/SrfK
VQLQQGSFVWRYPELPAVLRSQWSVGTNNVVLKGALMSFQDEQGDLATTGSMNTPTWQALVRAVLESRRDPQNYNYVYVAKTQPEHLELFENGKVTFRTLVNTGIYEAPTVDGTYPVYLRFTTTTMSGLLPDGQPYHDTGIPWVSYFNGGDALHGFIRSSYGFPQSLGCVEMPFAEAATLWPHTPIGTLVTVQ